MEYRVEALAAAAGVSVDTVRFYQGRGLLPRPRRVGRVAVYGDEHLARLRRIRELQRQDFSLAQIRRLLEQQSPPAKDLLRAALVEESVGRRTLSRAGLAAEAGVPESLVRAVQSAGLVEPLSVEGEERFSEADLEMARAALEILESGFPLPSLLDVAVRHAHNVQEVCDAAIELFDAHVRRQNDRDGGAEAVRDAFRSLLPHVTRLVALHFQRTLVNRALNRLEGKGEREALAAALETTATSRLDVEVTWR